MREKAGFGDVHFTTNRVAYVNSMLSDETDHREHQLPEFVVKTQQLAERQRRNVQWAVINRGPYRLHESLQHLELTEETWVQMDVVERESYVDMVLSSDVSLTKARDGSRVSATQTSQASADVVNAPKDGNNALSLLANIALADNLEREEVMK